LPLSLEAKGDIISDKVQHGVVPYSLRMQNTHRVLLKYDGCSISLTMIVAYVLPEPRRDYSRLILGRS
jgi:hypothetical protein